MPAQILPMLEPSQMLAGQRLADQNNYREQLVGLREARMQQEQALNPIRQQIMQTELQRGKQALDQSLTNFQQQKTMSDADLARTQAETQETQARTGFVQDQNKDFNANAQNRAAASDQEEMLRRAQIDHYKSMDAHEALSLSQQQSESQLKQSLMQQQLSGGAQDLAVKRSTVVNIAMALPEEERDAYLQPLISGGVITNKQYQMAKYAPDMSEDFGKIVGAHLGKDQQFAFEQALNQAHQKPSSDEILASQSKVNPIPLASTQGMSKAMSILSQALQARGKDDTTPSFPLTKDGKPDVESVQVGQVYKLPDPKSSTGFSRRRMVMFNGKLSAVDPSDAKYIPGD